MGSDERRQKRLARRKKNVSANMIDSRDTDGIVQTSNANDVASSDSKIATLLSKNEDDLLKFVVKVNKVYQDKLNRPAPFMTFVICGMQSAGKSTIMERFMSAVLNIVQEGTGTRCPLDCTTVHDHTIKEPRCELSGTELNLDSSIDCENMTMDQVFKAITEHNKRLADEDCFSTSSLNLVYRANNVQNMRFVDTPGIISNKGQGKDNREDIKDILRSTFGKENTKLCVLLEPKEFSTNPIIDFCDETFGGREWIDKAIFLMTKFDKQLEDSRTGSKANKFFLDFADNGIVPHLVITPTLPKEDLPLPELFKERRELIASATTKEKHKFDEWKTAHRKFLETNPDDELLQENIAERIGFESAKKVMRKIMLEDTARRLPEVLTSIRKELGSCQNELKSLKEREKFNDPKEVKLLVSQTLQAVEKKVLDYLDGDLETAFKNPDLLQTLDDELKAEEDSEWCDRELNHYSSEEEEWRDRVADLEYVDEMQAEVGFLGGKQVQRAIITFHLVMIDSLPDPYELKEYVPSGAGYLQGGLQRENWERAITSISQMTVKKISHPGINFLIKHVGAIIRRLFAIALNYIKENGELSSTFKLMPNAVESHILRIFDDMLWDLMRHAAEKSHVALEPMYTTLDPNLPTFHPIDEEPTKYDMALPNINDSSFSMDTPSKGEGKVKKMMTSYMEKVQNMMSLDGLKAKKMLRDEAVKKFTEKGTFLPDERTSMITNQESKFVIDRAFQYVVALLEFNNVMIRFQMNHYLYEGFKKRLSTFSREALLKDWETLVEPNDQIEAEIKVLEGKIDGLTESLDEVKRIQAKF